MENGRCAYGNDSMKERNCHPAIASLQIAQYSTKAESVSLAISSGFWFLHSRMTRSKLTGADIKAWREGIDQPRRWLADQLGVSVKTVESWEYGVRNPSGPALRLIEQLMNQRSRRK